MTSIKRRLSGTRTFAATYNNNNNNADAPMETGGLATNNNNDNNIAATAATTKEAQQQLLQQQILNSLAGPLPSPLFATSSIGGKAPQIKRFKPAVSLDESLKVAAATDGDTVADQQQEKEEAPPPQTTKISKLTQRLVDLQPAIIPKDTLTKKLDIPSLRRVASFVGDSFQDLMAFALMSRATRSACTHCVASVTIVPNETSIEDISRHGALDSFSQFLKRGDRGHHAKKFAIIDPRAVYDLEANVLGPSLSIPDMLRTINTMPNLIHVDVRGVALRGHTASSTEHFLNDVTRLCPLLQSLRIGLSIAKSWKKGWWLPVQNSLRELVIGSRREDSELLSTSSNKNTNSRNDDNDNDNGLSPTIGTVTPNNQFQLPYIDDLFLLMKTAPLQVLKIWPALAYPQLHQILFPTPSHVMNTSNNNTSSHHNNNNASVNAQHQFTNLQHLALNVGTTNANLLFSPEGDSVLHRERELLAAMGVVSGLGAGGLLGSDGKGSIGGGAAQQSTRGGPGGAGGGKGNHQAAAAAALEEANQKVMYPSMVSFTLADVHSKPDLIAELMQKLSLVAPDVRHWNITNTHRQGPTALAIQTAASQQRTRRPHAPG